MPTHERRVFWLIDFQGNKRNNAISLKLPFDVFILFELQLNNINEVSIQLVSIEYSNGWDTCNQSQWDFSQTFVKWWILLVLLKNYNFYSILKRKWTVLCGMDGNISLNHLYKFLQQKWDSHFDLNWFHKMEIKIYKKFSVIFQRMKSRWDLRTDEVWKMLQSTQLKMTIN